MNEVTMLSGTEPRKILQTVIDKKIPAVLSFLSKGKWHVAKVLLTSLGANKLDVCVLPKNSDSLQKAHDVSESNLPRPVPHPISIRINQPVGISLKYDYGKFIFETTVVAIEPSTGASHPAEEPATSPAAGGIKLSLLVPDRIEIVQRRSYFRVNVPGSFKVNVMLWHRRCTDETPEAHQNADVDRKSPECYWQGKLADISAGGMQIVIDCGQKPDFKKGQFVGMRFTPMPYETPMMLNAQIRNVLPTADQKCTCLGLQIVGLEASPEGLQILQRLCNVVEHYYRMNCSSATSPRARQELRTTGSTR